MKKLYLVTMTIEDGSGVNGWSDKAFIEAESKFAAQVEGAAILIVSAPAGIKEIRAEEIIRYQYTTAMIYSRLSEKFPGLEVRRSDLRGDYRREIPGHLLWMMAELQGFSNDIDGVAKAGAWIGWVIAHAEMLGLMTNDESREEKRKDSKARYY